MKKFLLTTTALVATAGFAAAEVSISGSAEMGITKPKEKESLRFHQSIDVNFSMSAETDGGLSISTGVDLDEAGKIADAESGTGGTSVALSGDFGNVTLGDTDGAADWATSEIGSIMPGSITDQSTSISGMQNDGLDGNSDSDGISTGGTEAKKNSNGYSGQILRYDNSIGGVGFAVSIERPDNTDATNAPSMGFALGAKFDAGPVTVGVGMQNAEITRMGFNREGAGSKTSTAEKTTGSGGTLVTVSDAKALKGKRKRTILSASGEMSGIKYAVLYSTGKDQKFIQTANNDNKDGSGTAKAADEKGALNDDAYREDKVTNLQAGVSYSADNFSVGVGISQSKKAGVKDNGNALAASYDLGGGAKVLFGYNSDKKYSLGLSMSF